jgi:hypothetical protein
MLIHPRALYSMVGEIRAGKNLILWQTAVYAMVEVFYQHPHSAPQDEVFFTLNKPIKLPFRQTINISVFYLSKSENMKKDFSFCFKAKRFKINFC